MALTLQEAQDVIDAGSPDQADDAAFVAALRAERPDAYQRLVELYQTPLFNLALRIVQDREDARDVVQEVFIKALRSLPQTHGRLHVRAWLYRVTMNASYDHLRSARRRPLPIEGAELDRPSPIDEIRRAELAWLFGETLQTLPERQKVALVLKDVHGLPHSEIAEALGISRGSAEVLLFRARHGFRRRFTALCGDDDVAQPCRLAEREAAYAVGAGLPAARRRRLLEHARTCPACRRTIESWGDAAVGLAVVFPLVSLSEGTAAAAGIGSAATVCDVAASGAVGLGLAAGSGAGASTLGAAGVAGGGAGFGAAGGLAGGLCSAGALAGGATVSGIIAKLATMVTVKATAAVVAGACAVTAGGVVGAELVKKHDGRSAATTQTAAVLPADAGEERSTGSTRVAAPVRTSGGAQRAASSRVAEAGAASVSDQAALTSPDAAAASVAGEVQVVALDLSDGVAATTYALVLLDGRPLSAGLWSQALVLRDAGHPWSVIASSLGFDLVTYTGCMTAVGPGIWTAPPDACADDPSICVTAPDAAVAPDADPAPDAVVVPDADPAVVPSPASGPEEEATVPTVPGPEEGTTVPPADEDGPACEGGDAVPEDGDLPGCGDPPEDADPSEGAGLPDYGDLPDGADAVTESGAASSGETQAATAEASASTPVVTSDSAPADEPPSYVAARTDDASLGTAVD
jgi:RNA polymerase sigma-70 factor (ECF subfamily)